MIISDSSTSTGVTIPSLPCHASRFVVDRDWDPNLIDGPAEVRNHMKTCHVTAGLLIHLPSRPRRAASRCAMARMVDAEPKLDYEYVGEESLHTIETTGGRASRPRIEYE